MKKVLIAAAALVAVLVVAVVVTVNVIDWSQHKQQITAQVQAATGRTLTIGGDIGVSFLPSPALVVDDVRLANAPGAEPAEMARLRSLEVRISLAALLGGEIQVETLKLVEPVLHVQRLADGRWNFDVGTPESTDQTADAAATDDGGGPGFDVRFDNVLIEDGIVVYADAASGTQERIAGIDARLQVGSLQGPFDGEAAFTLRGVPLEVEASVGRVDPASSVPFRLSVATGRGEARVQASGSVSGLDAEPRAEGRVEVAGDDLAALLRATVGGGALPGFLAQPFALEATLDGTATAAVIEPLTARLGETRANGVVRASWDGTATITAELAANRVDLDAWMAMPEGEGTGGTATPATPATAAGPPAADAFALPADLNVSAALSVDVLTFRGGVIRQARANADLAAGEITVSQLTAQLPAGSEAAAFGFVTVADGKPRFEGEVEAASADLRGALDWLQVEVPAVPTDRLRTLSLKATVVGTPDQVQLRGIDLRVNGSRLSGGVAVALSARPSFGADVTIDRLPLDAYLPKADEPAPSGGAGAGADSGAGADAGVADMTGGLDAFDANLRARIKILVYNATPLSEVVVDATLHAGTLTLRRASVGDAAGASANLTGTLRSGDAGPVAEDLSFLLNVPDPPRLARLLAVDLTPMAAGVGAVAASGTVNGLVTAPAVDVTVRLAGGEITAAGAVQWLAAPGFDGRVRLQHADVSRLARTLGVDWRPAGPLGPTDASASIAAGPIAVSVRELSGTLTGIAVAGTADADLSGERPKVTADLRTGRVVIDRLLPAERTAALTPRFVPAGFPVAPVPATGAALRPIPVAVTPHARWSRDPLDLTALQGLDATVTLASEALVMEPYALEDATIHAVLTDGVLNADRIEGALLGGALKANATVDGRAVPRIEATVALAGGDLARATAASTGSQQATGKIDLDARLATAGGSVLELVSALAGQGSVAVTDADVKGDVGGGLLMPLVGLFKGLGQAGAAVAGRSGSSKATITGTYRITNGIVRSDDIKLTSYLGDGVARGATDLPAWQVDLNGEMQVATNVLNALVGRATGSSTTQAVPFRVYGSMDDPTYQFDTAALAAAGLQIPGLDRLRDVGGIGDVLNAIIPGTRPRTEPQPQPQQQQPQQQPQQQRSAPSPADILRQLIR